MERSRVGDGELERQIAGVCADLVESVRAAVESLPVRPAGPQALASALGVDKVLASRVLKATRSADPMVAAHAMPGPEPLRRLVRAAGARGASEGAVSAASAAIDRFEALIQVKLGDRSTLDTILSAWVPEARREFELRRKQALFRGLSQLKGAQADVLVATVLVAPGAGADRLDVVWLTGVVRLQRIRPGVRVKLTTRRLAESLAARQPVSMGGAPVERAEGLLLTDFCSVPTPTLEVHRVGETVAYVLGEGPFGPGSESTLFFGEVNRGELPRYLPAGSSRRSYFFAEANVCSKVLQFDAIVHRDLYPSGGPQLRIYDTAFEGIADVNDPSRDLDRLDLLERVESIGEGLGLLRSGDVPRYHELVGQTLAGLGWSAGQFRGYRCRVDYPVYGSQVTLAFEPERR